MRVVFHYLTFGTALTGGPRVVDALIALLGDRIDPLVITQQDGALSALLRARGVPVTVVPLPAVLDGALDASRRSLLAKAPALWRGVAEHSEAVRRAAAAHAPHIWWGRNVWTVLLGAGAARRLGAPFIWDLALGFAPGARLGAGAMRALHMAAALRCARVVLEADVVQGQVFGPLAGLLARRLVTIPSGVAPERIAALRGVAATRSAAAAGAPLRVLVLGSLNPRKNQLLVLEALRRLGSDAASLQVTMAGDEPDAVYAGRVREAIRDYGLAASVTLAGWHADVTPLMRDADVLALPSRAEGVPMVVREAAFARLPVIAAAVGGLTAVVAHGVTGRLVPDDDPDALAAELRWAAGHRAELQALGDTAAAGADTLYDPRRWADRYYELMTELAARRRRA